jgi:hypothetical protein
MTRSEPCFAGAIIVKRFDVLKIAPMNAYTHLPLTQRRTQQIVDQFNATEELSRSLETKRLRRRELYPDLSPELQKQLDLLDFANAQLPLDCIGFVVEP